MTHTFEVLGARCFVETSAALPLISVVVSTRTGAAHDPPGQDGLARVMLRMLRRGCAGHTSQTFEEALDLLGSELGIDTSASTMTVHGQVIRKSAEGFADLVGAMLGQPTFAIEEFERLLRETKAEILAARDSDQTLAQIAFRRAVFGEQHAFGRGSAGRLSTIGSITEPGIRAFYKEHFVRGNMVLGFAGDVTEELARDLASRLLGGMPEGTGPSDAIAEPTLSPGRRLVFVDKPERTQAQVLIGGLGTHPCDPDHVPLAAGTAIFGGTFTSRLMREVRSKRGWSYGASARLAIERARHAFVIATFPGAADAPACLALELDLLQKFTEGGVTPREVRFIRSFLSRSHAFDVDTPTKRLHQPLDVELLHLPEAYYSGYLDHIKGLTPEAINAGVRARLSTSDLAIVVVGSASEIGAAMEAAIPGLSSSVVVPFDRD